MSRTSHKSTRTLAVACVAIISLASCGGSSKNDAASVEGSAIPKSTLETTLTQLSDAGQIKLENGVVPMDAVRSVLAAIIRGEATKQILAQYNVTVTDADTKAVVDQISQDAGYDKLGQELKDLIIGLNSGDLALARVKAPSEADIEKMYNETPASVGAMCAEHILVKDESTAKEVIQKLNDGGDFKKLAGEYSTEPNAATTGGILGSTDGDCISLSDYQSQFDSAFTAGALTAKVGVPTGPVKSSFGYHVIMIRPFADIKASLVMMLSKSPGILLMTGFLATHKVTIASEYGRWDAATGKITDL
jgi:foldase protein PrsA